MNTELENRTEQQVSTDMRQDIDDTRSAMADKMEALQDRVMDTVQSAQETVEDSIQSANDTMTSVKHAFDLKYQVEQHPWAMVGGSVLAGLALSSMLLRRTRQIPHRPDANEPPRPSLPPGDEVKGSPAVLLFRYRRAATAVRTPLPCPRSSPRHPRSMPRHPRMTLVFSAHSRKRLSSDNYFSGQRQLPNRRKRSAGGHSFSPQTPSAMGEGHLWRKRMSGSYGEG